jgi:hypothetical protein
MVRLSCSSNASFRRWSLEDKRDMTFEIAIQEESLLPLRKAFLWYEEAPTERLRAGSSNRREHVGPVIWTERADFDRTTVAKTLDGHIVGESRHEKWFPPHGLQAAPP